MKRNILMSAAGLGLAATLAASPVAAQDAPNDPGAHLYGAGHAVTAGLNLIFLPLGVLNGTAGAHHGGGAGTAPSSGGGTVARAGGGAPCGYYYGLPFLGLFGCNGGGGQAGAAGGAVSGTAALTPGSSLRGGPGEPSLEIVR